MDLPHPKKRIIICCDGTWMDSDGDVQVPSNVTKLARSIRPVGHDHSTTPPTPIPQVVFYQNGVGTGSNSLWTKYVGGATGEGMSYHIREAYSFLCHNYHTGDEIFFVGFSRGAFIARSVSSLVRAVGLLTPAGLKFLTPIFEDWKYQGKKSWKSKHNRPWPNRPALYTKEYQRKLLELELTRPDIQVKCVAVWDTVGALGIPRIAVLPQAPSEDYAFVDTRVEPNIEYAYQALALDEHRRSYHPTIWEKPDGQILPYVLKQTWFPGVHSDIGGSYDDADLANLTLAWMVSQLEPLLSIDHELITREVRLAKEAHEARHETVREWGLGKIHNSMSPFFRVWGSLVRTPKENYEIDRFTRKDTGRRLENTFETVHSSVRIRMGRMGLGYDDKGRYDSSALEGWTMHCEDTNPDTPIAQGLPGPVGKMKNVVWKKKVRKPRTGNSKSEKAAKRISYTSTLSYSSSVNGRRSKGEKQVHENEEDFETLEMPEDVLQGFERRLLNLWPGLARDFDATPPGRHRTFVERAKTYPAQPDQTESKNGAGTPKLSPTILPERIRSLKRNLSRKDSKKRDSLSSLGSGARGGSSTAAPAANRTVVEAVTDDIITPSAAGAIATAVILEDNEPENVRNSTTSIGSSSSPLKLDNNDNIITSDGVEAKIANGHFKEIMVNNTIDIIDVPRSLLKGRVETF